MWCWRRMDKMKWSEKETNEVLDDKGEERTVLNHIQTRKVKGPMTEVKIRIRRTQLHDDVTVVKYRELKEEANDCERWKLQFHIERKEEIQICVHIYIYAYVYVYACLN